MYVCNQGRYAQPSAMFTSTPSALHRLSFHPVRLAPRPHAAFLLRPYNAESSRTMGKKKVAINEDILVLPPHPSHSIVPIVDTHTHLVSTFAAYKHKWPSGSHATIFDFVRGVYGGSTTKVRSIVDVWCEAPVRRVWREIADSALTEEGRQSLWGGIDYWFVMGACGPIAGCIASIDARSASSKACIRKRDTFEMQSALGVSDRPSRHEAKLYNDHVEKDMCVYRVFRVCPLYC